MGKTRADQTLTLVLCQYKSRAQVIDSLSRGEWGRAVGSMGLVVLERSSGWVGGGVPQDTITAGCSLVILSEKLPQGRSPLFERHFELQKKLVVNIDQQRPSFSLSFFHKTCWIC